jgi:hypothetical protein
MTTNGIVMFNGKLLPNRAYQVSVATPFHATDQGYLNGVLSINIILKNKKVKRFIFDKVLLTCLPPKQFSELNKLSN